MRNFIEIIPEQYRRRGVWVVATIFVRALLNYIGLAMMLPILLLILDPESITPTGSMSWLYRALGADSSRGFAVIVSLGVLGIICLKSLMSLWLYRIERNYIYDLYSHLSRKLYTAYFRSGLSFIKSSNSAHLARNVNVVCFAFVGGVLRPIATIFCDVTLFGLLLLSLVIYSPMAALLSVGIFIPALLIYYLLFRRKLIRYGSEENAAQREKSRIVIESFRGFAEIEVNNAFETMRERFDRALERIVELQRKNSTLAMLPSIFIETGLALGMVLLVLWGLNHSTQSAAILFGIFSVAALKLMPSIRSIINSWATIKYNYYTVETLDQALKTPVKSTDSSRERLPLKGQISIEGLSFSYPDQPDKLVIKDLNLTIRKGETVGIKGASGGGKSTLFYLLMGLIKPTSGTIKIDNNILNDGNIRQWQNSIGYVSQSVFLTDSSLAENIALGSNDEQIDLCRVERAVELAQLKEFVSTLKSGVKSSIGECGCRLSGGQRQRIGIARALYNQNSVLLFDEATSALDSTTESEINHSLEELTKSNPDITIIIIAHRDSSLAYCDRIIEI